MGSKVAEACAPRAATGFGFGRLQLSQGIVGLPCNQKRNFHACTCTPGYASSGRSLRDHWAPREQTLHQLPLSAPIEGGRAHPFMQAVSASCCRVQGQASGKCCQGGRTLRHAAIAGHLIHFATMTIEDDVYCYRKEAKPQRKDGDFQTYIPALV